MTYKRTMCMMRTGNSEL